MPLGLDAGKEAGGRGIHRLCSDQKPMVSSHHLQAQRKEVRGPVAPGGPTSESPLYASSQSSDRGRTPRAPPQRARLPEAMEPPETLCACLQRAPGPKHRAVIYRLHVPFPHPWDSPGKNTGVEMRAVVQ